jgi:hypothetical protein
VSGEGDMSEQETIATAKAILGDEPWFVTQFRAQMGKFFIAPGCSASVRLDGVDIRVQHDPGAMVLYCGGIVARVEPPESWKTKTP